jgi:hypothetical protein
MSETGSICDAKRQAIRLKIIDHRSRHMTRVTAL